MSIVPILLDMRPRYCGTASSAPSLLLLPTADDLLLREVMRSVQRVTAHRPIVLAGFEATAEYQRAIRTGYSDVDSITGLTDFHLVVERFNPSDSFLFVSPSCYPADGIDLSSVCRASAIDARMARHLVAFEAPTLRTKELVQTDEDGRVRKIQRYFEPVTWPFPAGVLASLVPVACAQMVLPLTLFSLEGLRAQLSASGIPNEDVPFHGDCFDLADEAGALALGERRVAALDTLLELSKVRSRERRTLHDPTARIHPEARVVGPVVIGERVVVGAGALIVGPSILGDGASVADGAIVAQCMVLPEASVAAGASIRHRVVSGDVLTPSTVGDQRRHTASHAPVAPEPSRRRFTAPKYVTIKALCEPVLAALALVVLSPLMLVLAAIVKLTSSGPIFYGDAREGKDAQLFKCWKFRSMVTNADDLQRALAAQQKMDGPQFKMENDPRVTKIGRIMRKLNVDELPQLWNVVCGEMSFVGPRPSPFRENQICVPWRNGRLSVRPGITGLWQVCRKDRSNGDFHQWIHYDLLYVRNLSFRLDFLILAATIITLGGKKPVPLSLMLGRRANTPTKTRRRVNLTRVSATSTITARTPVHAGSTVSANRRRWTSSSRIALVFVTLAAAAPAEALAQGASVLGAAPRAHNLLRLTTLIEGGYDSNVRFLAGGDAAAISRASAALAADRVGARGRLGLTGSVSGARYQDVESLNNISWDVTVRGDRRVTGQLRTTASAGYSTRLSNDLVGVFTTPILRLSRQRAATANATAAYRFSPHVSVGASVAFAAVRFDTPSLVPGNRVTLHVESRKLLGSRSAVELSGDIEEGSANGAPLQSQSASAAWEPGIRPVRLRLSSGVIRVSSGLAPTYQPIGAISVADSLGPGAWNVNASRTAAQAFGLGLIVTSSSLSVSYSFLPLKGNFFTFGANTGTSVTSDAAATTFKTSAATASVRRVLITGLTFGGEAFYRNRADIVRASGFGGQLSFGYTFEDR